MIRVIVFNLFLFNTVMCLMCGLAQSLPLLSIGYDPTPADIAEIQRLSQSIALVAQVDRERLSELDTRVDEVAAIPTLSTNPRSEYIITAIDDMIEQAKILY